MQVSRAANALLHGLCLAMYRNSLYMDDAGEGLMRRLGVN